MMEELFQQLIDICNDNGYSNDDIKEITKAYEYAKKQHKGMKRKNGDIYISHPLNVAIIVANLNPDASAVVASLIHETIDHGSSSFEEIEEIFGTDIKNVVVSLNKVNRLHLLEDSEVTSLYLRKVLVALSEDVRVIIIKLAGRLHNLRTLEGLPPELQKIKALETRNVLIPIAHRLGINYIKAEMEDITFKILKPEIYDEIEASLPAPREELNDYLKDMMNDISEMLSDNGLQFEMKGRVKSVSSLHNKLSNGKKWKEIYDILGIRIICEEVSDCYLIIGLIHSLYRPIPRRFKDYIAMPKGNSYQSLHTGILGLNGYPVEVQVRTKDMNEIAEHGVASHWSYKEKGKKNMQNVMEQKLQMFRNIIDVNSDEISDDDAFAESLENELLSDLIYVYTPKGDVVELPAGASPIDFAYRIHSRVGDTTVGAVVNDQIVPLDYELQNNDVIKIMTNSSSQPNKDWLNIVKTTAAKNKIKSYFSKKDKEEYIYRGKELLERELRRQKISYSDALTEERIDKILKDLKVGSLDEVFLLLGSMRYTPIYIINLLFEDKQNVQDILLDKVMNNTNAPTRTNYKNDIIVSGCDDILVNLASCCKPVLHDDIIGYITKGQGITVHKKDCVNIKDVTDRLIDVSWNDKNTDVKQYITKVSVLTNGIDNKLVDIITKATQRSVNVSSLNEIEHNGKVTYDLLIKVQNKDDLDLFISDVNSLPFVESVKRY